MKKEFLVGINDYLPAGEGGPDLRGCVNDVKDMTSTLQIIGFPLTNMKVCTNRQATKANILNGLTWLISNVKRGDELVFFYSGHGSQIIDISGDDLDQKDEILCPTDLEFQKKTYITDDDLKNIFSRLHQGINLQVIIDSCHSGTVTREWDTTAPRGTARTIAVGRYIQAPFEYTMYFDYDPTVKKRGILKPSKGARETSIVNGLNHALWTACRDNQTSMETSINGQIRGVFTYYFCKILRKTNGNITNRKLDSLLTASLAGTSQIPQLEISDTAMLDRTFTSPVVKRVHAEITEEEEML